MGVPMFDFAAFNPESQKVKEKVTGDLNKIHADIGRDMSNTALRNAPGFQAAPDLADVANKGALLARSIFARRNRASSFMPTSPAPPAPSSLLGGG